MKTECAIIQIKAIDNQKCCPIVVLFIAELHAGAKHARAEPHS